MEKTQQTDLLVRDMEDALSNALQQAEYRLELVQDKINTLSPYAILNRGYSMIFGPDGKTPLTDPAQAPAGTVLTGRLAKGTIKLRSENEK